MMDDQRRFSEQEFGLILRKAAEIQADGRTSGAAGGMLLSEIQEIAADAGIDPTLIERAIQQVDTAKGEIDSPHGPLQMTAWVDGEIAREDMGRLRDAIRNSLGSKSRGTVEEVFDSLEWSPDAGSGVTTQITVTPRDGQTRIELYDALSNPKGIAYSFPILGGMIGGMLAGGGLATLLALDAGAFVIGGMVIGPLFGWALGRKIWSRMYPKHRAEIAGKLERLREATARLIKPAKELPTEEAKAISAPAGEATATLAPPDES